MPPPMECKYALQGTLTGALTVAALALDVLEACLTC